MGKNSLIDHISGIPANITFSDLRIHYGTGRAIHLSGSGKDKKYTYRAGIQTDLGDIEINVWQEAMRRLIHSCGEDALQQALVAYVTDNSFWWHTQVERQQEALSLHASRIFENQKWVDYDLFHHQYFPKVNT